MSLYINHNMMAANAARNLSNIYSNLSTSVQRLSSGLRINSAADDAAGLAVRELMRADIAVINQGVRNASDAISMIQTAEGAMSVIDEKLIRMKELAEQAATGTYTTAQRLIMDSEYQAMAAEIDRIANATDFNGIKLLDGTLATQHDGSGLKVHFGTGNESAEDYYFVSIGDMKATSVTGLQVGDGGGTMSTAGGFFRTTGLNLTDTDTDTIGTSGTFGIQASSDGTNWSCYGYLKIEASDTLDDLLAKINGLGNAGNSGFTIDNTATSANLAGDNIRIANHVFTFSTAISGATANTIGMAGLSLASIAANTQYAINTWATVGNANGVYALDQGTGHTFVLYDSNFGAGATTVGTSDAFHIIVAPSTIIGGGVFDAVSASAVEDPDNAGEYELQLEGTDGYLLRLTLPDGSLFTANSSTDGGAPTLGASQASFSINTGAASYVTTWSDANEASEWFSSNTIPGSAWDGADIQTQSAAQLALAQIDAAINRKDTARASLGALQNRLENTITNLQIQAENLQASESRISDVDVALEMTEFTRNNIMTQAAVSMLAQANSLPQLALQLLG